MAFCVWNECLGVMYSKHNELRITDKYAENFENKVCKDYNGKNATI